MCASFSSNWTKVLHNLGDVKGITQQPSEWKSLSSSYPQKARQACFLVKCVMTYF